MQAEALFLGTGGSMGVPVVGCSCPVCLSSDSKDKRLRPSLLIRKGHHNYLIDCGPDFRTQAITSGLKRIDAVLITHPHYDHTAGLDDLRGIFLKDNCPIHCYLSQNSFRDIKRRFYYLFEEEENPYLTRFHIEMLKEKRGWLELPHGKVRYFDYRHADTEVCGFRFGTLAYLTDIKEYPESIFEDLHGIETLIISSPREEESPIHFSVNDAVEFFGKTGAKEVYLTHISHHMKRVQIEKTLPKNVKLSYDGQLIYFTW